MSTRSTVPARPRWRAHLVPTRLVIGPPVIETRPPASVPAKDAPRPRPSRPREPGPDAPPAVVTAHIAISALRIIAALLVAFVAHVALLGSLTQHRDQAVLYDEVRESLARGETTLGQTDIDGRLLAPGTPVAVLEIPSLALRQVVVEGTSSAELTSGPGHRRDTVLPGQAGVSIVMGRQAGFGGPFGRITELRLGATILVTTGQGRHEYRVLAARGAGDPAPAPPAVGTGRLTLMTGDGWAYLPTDVLRVDATLVSEAFPSAARTVTAAQLRPAELAMQGDPSAYVPLLLWSQLFLVAVAATSWTRVRWGRWQTWLVSVPLLTVLFLEVADQVARLLPNLL
ncbi:MAG: class E sortase [Pseudorhodobacter sp.]|nr:class E sortase [Frankiaceae bacterium]